MAWGRRQSDLLAFLVTVPAAGIVVLALARGGVVRSEALLAFLFISICVTGLLFCGKLREFAVKVWKAKFTGSQQPEDRG